MVHFSYAIPPQRVFVVLVESFRAVGEEGGEFFGPGVVEAGSSFGDRVSFFEEDGLGFTVLVVYPLVVTVLEILLV